MEETSFQTQVATFASFFVAKGSVQDLTGPAKPLGGDEQGLWSNTGFFLFLVKLRNAVARAGQVIPAFTVNFDTDFRV